VAEGTRLRAYVKLAGAQVRSQATYRLSFVLDMLSNILATALDVLAVLVLFRVTKTLGGFNVNEVLLIVGLAGTSFTLADFAVGNIERIQFYVRTGLMDAILLRPLGSLFQLLTTDFTMRRALRCVLSVGVLMTALGRLDIQWSPVKVAMVLMAPLSGATFFAAVFVATATVALWWIDSGEMANSVTYGGYNYTLYPSNIFQGVFRRIFTYALGFGFVAYYPALIILGRDDPIGLPNRIGLLSPAIAAIAAVGAATMWRAGIRHYRSTGS
jgi:ABC-2 type transport system permease protein